MWLGRVARTATGPKHGESPGDVPARPTRSDTTIATPVPSDFRLTAFLLDAGELGHATPQMQEVLSSYLQAFVSDGSLANAAARVMLHNATDVEEPVAFDDERTAKQCFEQLHGTLDSLRGQLSLANKQVLSLKADALGKRFFQEDSLRQLRHPEISHRELSDSPITSPQIDAAKEHRRQLEERVEKAHDLAFSLAHALDCTSLA